MVHTEEEVEASRVNVKNPSHAGGKTVDAEVHAAIEPFQGYPVGAQTGISPGLRSAEASAAQETEGNPTIGRQVILCTEVHSSTDAGGSSTRVGDGLQIGEVD